MTTETKPIYDPPSEQPPNTGMPATAIPLGGGVGVAGPPMLFYNNNATSGVRLDAASMPAQGIPVMMQGVPVVMVPGGTPYTQMVYMHTPKTSPFAVASLVLGIVSLFTFFLGIILSILAIVFGVMAIHSINNQPHEYDGLCFAYSGMSLGALYLAFVSAMSIQFALG